MLLSVQRATEDDFGDSGSDDEGRPDHDENKPTVVVLKQGDLTAEEVDTLMAHTGQQAADDGKLGFVLMQCLIFFKIVLNRWHCLKPAMCSHFIHFILPSSNLLLWFQTFLLDDCYSKSPRRGLPAKKRPGCPVSCRPPAPRG